MRIVVIDGDTVFTGSLNQRCAKAGVNCQIFAQGQQALAEIKKNPDGIDIVLLAKEQADGSDGLALAQALRKDPRTQDVPYILMSSTWGKADFAKHQKTPHGANAYYSKKSSLAELEATVEAVTGSKFTGKPNANSTRATITGGLLEVKLQTATEVVNIAEEVPDGIFESIPIDLFPDGDPEPTIAAPTPNTSLKMELTPPPIDTGNIPVAVHGISETTNAGARATADSGGIDIALGGEEFMIETARGTVSESNATATVASPPPAPKNELLEVSLSAATGIPNAPTPTSTSSAAVSMPEMEISADVAPAASPEPAFDFDSAATVVRPLSSMAPQLDIAEPLLAAAPPSPPAAPSPVSEEEAARDLPYLFTGPNATRGTQTGTPLLSSMSMPSVDINTGGPLSNDLETLKKYLMMREQDVSVLSAQLTYAKEELAKSDDTIKRQALENEDLLHQLTDVKERVSAQDQELEHAGKSKEGELEQLRFEVKSKIDRIKFVEERLNDSAAQYEKLKERVRIDIRKIRVREKELESKLEILKKDSETLIASRENKILELKRKVDLLEFNYDTLQDKLEGERENVRKAHEKLERVHKVVKLASGVIEAEEESNPDLKIA